MNSKTGRLRIPSKLPNPRSLLFFQVPRQQNEKPVNLENSREYMIQNQSDYTQSLNRLEAQMDRLENMLNARNEEILLNIFLTISNLLSQID